MEQAPETHSEAGTSERGPMGSSVAPGLSSDDGNVQLWNADCLDVLPLLLGVDAVITDPPYGINANYQTLGAGKKEFDRGESWDAGKVDNA